MSATDATYTVERDGDRWLVRDPSGVRVARVQTRRTADALAAERTASLAAVHAKSARSLPGEGSERAEEGETSR